MPIKLNGSTSGYSQLQAAAVAASNTLTLPASNGALVAQSTTTAPTNGQIPIGNGTDYTPATITAGSGVTVTNGAGTISIAATGKIIQVVQGVLNTRASTTSATFADTGLTVSITPTVSTSKILVMVTIGDAGAATSAGTLGLNLVRGSTNIAQGTASGSSTVTTFGVGSFGDQNASWGSQSITYLDSPATTSATTYKVQFASTYNSISCTINGSNNNAGSYNLSTYSTITVMEIAA
jgi:hypothetical protein